MDPNINQPQEPIQPIIPPPTPQNPLHLIKTLLISLAAILVLSSIAGGIYLLAKNQTKPTSTIQASPTPDPTANWKTVQYENLSFKIPPAWHSGEVIWEPPGGSRSIIAFSVNPEPFKRLITSQTHEGTLESFQLNLEKKETVGNLKTKREANRNLFKEFEEKQTTIDSKAAVIIKEVWPPGQADVELTHYRAYIQVGPDVYSFNAVEYPISAQLLKVYFDQILSTFRFTDPTADWIRKQFSTSWDIKYPSDWNVNTDGTGEGSLGLEGLYKNNGYSILFSYPIGPYETQYGKGSLEQWVIRDLIDIQQEKNPNIKITDISADGAPAKKVLNIPIVNWVDQKPVGTGKTEHSIYIWEYNNINQRAINIEQTSGVFNSEQMEELLDLFLKEIK